MSGGGPGGAGRANDLHADERAHFMSTMGFDYRVEGDGAVGRVDVDSYLCTGEGWASAAVLLTFADVLIGLLASHRTAPRISVTANLSVQVLAPLPPGGSLQLTGDLGKVGRAMSVGETQIRSAGNGALVATAVGTFLASPRPQDVATGRWGFTHEEERIVVEAATLGEQVGLRDREPGVAEISLRPDLLNATESLQGGLVALLGERAAQTAASAALGEPAVLRGLEVHYLAAARVGPFVARSRLLAPDLVRVEIRDPGKEDRLVALVVGHAITARSAQGMGGGGGSGRRP